MGEIINIKNMEKKKSNKNQNFDENCLYLNLAWCDFVHVSLGRLTYVDDINIIFIISHTVG